MRYSRCRLKEVPDRRRTPFNSKMEKLASNDTRTRPCLAWLQYAQVIRRLHRIEAGLQENILRNFEFPTSYGILEILFYGLYSSGGVPIGCYHSDAGSGVATAVILGK